MERIPVNGTELAVRRAGTGEALVLVHGSANDMRSWDGVFDTLAEHFAVTAVSRRYHRPNPPIEPGADYPFGEQLDDLAALVTQVAPQGAHLIGHSFGGLLALVLTARKPELVHRLVLMEPPALGLWVSDPPRPGEVLRLMVSDPALGVPLIRFGARVIAPAKAALRRGDKAEAIRIFGSGVMGARFFGAAPPQEIEIVRENFIAEELLGSGLPKLDPDLPARVRAPVLLVRGEHSPPVFGAVSQRLERRLPDARSVTIPGASHAMHRQARDAFLPPVLDFLTA